jgi:hypothetical protein
METEPEPNPALPYLIQAEWIYRADSLLAHRSLRIGD